MNAEPQSLFDWQAARDAGMAQVAENAGPDFATRAKAFVPKFLREHGPATGEQITDAAKAAGIEAHDDRAMGPVLMALSRSKVIVKCGHAVRTKGHGCSGANLWCLSITTYE